MRTIFGQVSVSGLLLSLSIQCTAPSTYTSAGVDHAQTNALSTKGEEQIAEPKGGLALPLLHLLLAAIAGLDAGAVVTWLRLDWGDARMNQVATLLATYEFSNNPERQTRFFAAVDGLTALVEAGALAPPTDPYVREILEVTAQQDAGRLVLLLGAEATRRRRGGRLRPVERDFRRNVELIERDSIVVRPRSLCYVNTRGETHPLCKQRDHNGFWSDNITRLYHRSGACGEIGSNAELDRARFCSEVRHHSNQVCGRLIQAIVASARCVAGRLVAQKVCHPRADDPGHAAAYAMSRHILSVCRTKAAELGCKDVPEEESQAIERQAREWVCTRAHLRDQTF